MPDAAMTEREDVRRCVAHNYGIITLSVEYIVSKRDLRGRQDRAAMTRAEYAEHKPVGTLLIRKL